MKMLWPVLLLTISNIFMTFAWYGHLKFMKGETRYWLIILISWGIAFFEYCFMIPANRIGSENYSAAQLKITQEAITLVVFCFFSVFYLRENLRWNYIVGFVLMLAAVGFVFFFKEEPTSVPPSGETAAIDTKPQTPDKEKN